MGEQPNKHQPDGASKAPALAGRRLAVADDDPDQLMYLSTVFEDHGATVFKATNGDEALAVVRSEKPDLLTLDLEMPGLNAGEVFEALRNTPGLENLKICIVTGRPELRKLIYQRSVRPPEGFLTKPVSEDELLRTARKLLALTH